MRRGMIHICNYVCVNVYLGMIFLAVFLFIVAFFYEIGSLLVRISHFFISFIIFFCFFTVRVYICSWCYRQESYYKYVYFYSYYIIVGGETELYIFCRLFNLILIYSLRLIHKPIPVYIVQYIQAKYFEI